MQWALAVGAFNLYFNFVSGTVKKYEISNCGMGKTAENDGKCVWGWKLLCLQYYKNWNIRRKYCNVLLNTWIVILSDFMQINCKNCIKLHKVL